MNLKNYKCILCITAAVVLLGAAVFCFIGNSDVCRAKDKQKFTEHTLDNFLPVHDNKTI